VPTLVLSSFRLVDQTPERRFCLSEVGNGVSLEVNVISMHVFVQRDPGVGEWDSFVLKVRTRYINTNGLKSIYQASLLCFEHGSFALRFFSAQVVLHKACVTVPFLSSRSHHIILKGKRGTRVTSS